MRQLAIVFYLVLPWDRKKRNELSAHSLLKQQSLGPGAVMPRVRGVGSPLFPGLSLRGGSSHFNRKLCVKTRFADKQRSGSLFLPAGSSAVFPAKESSEKVKANIFFPLKWTQIFHQPVSLLTVRMDLLVFGESQHQKKATFCFCLCLVCSPVPLHLRVFY